MLAVRAGAEIHRESSLVALQTPATPKDKEPPPPSMATHRLLSAGSDAARLSPEASNGACFLHPVRHGRIVDLAAMETVLRALFAHAPRSRLRALLPGSRMNLVLSNHLEAPERFKFQELMRDFGFSRIRQVESIQAAAAACGFGADTTAGRHNVGGRMVIDLGGGKTSMGVFSMGEMTAWHWFPIGGARLERAIADYVEERYRIRLPLSLAERIKIAIGSVYPKHRPETFEITGRDLSSGIEKILTLNDNELRDVLVDACEPLVMTIQQGFEEVAPELAADIMHNGVSLVGGGALLSGLSEFLRDRTGLTFHPATDPINAVIRGAMVLAERRQPD